MELLPKEPHCGLFVGATGVGKTVFVLDLLENIYKDYFEYIVIFCSTLRNNKTYREREFVWKDDGIFLVDLGSPERTKGSQLNDYLKFFYEKLSGHECLFIIDDCSHQKDIVQKRNILAELAFSGRHANISVWVLTQKYNAVLKDFREQLKFVCLFYCKDRDSFEECLRENDVIPSESERKEVKKNLNQTIHSKLILKTSQPSGYKILM